MLLQSSLLRLKGSVDLRNSIGSICKGHFASSSLLVLDSHVFLLQFVHTPLQSLNFLLLVLQHLHVLLRLIKEQLVVLLQSPQGLLLLGQLLLLFFHLHLVLLQNAGTRIPEEAVQIILPCPIFISAAFSIDLVNLHLVLSVLIPIQLCIHFLEQVLLLEYQSDLL